MNYFQNSFNCHLLELVGNAPLPIHKVTINAIFQDGMNGIYLYSVNKHLSSWPLFGTLTCSAYSTATWGLDLTSHPKDN